jgi:2-(1,2-epoxy-1,2-dihydrophenyl)acetyl-CoA isomerase
MSRGSAESTQGLPTTEVDGAVATVTFRRPERLNAFDTAVAESLAEQLRAAAADDAVRVVVLTGAGRGFCAGGDLHELAGAEVPDAEALRATMRRLTQVSVLLHEMPKVTIAAINGPCAGAGLAFACAADLRVAAASAVLTSAFLRVGQSGDYGATWLLPRTVGPARARELLLLGDRWSAQEAERIGLVGKVVPDTDLQIHVHELAHRLAGYAPSAVAALKANLADADGVPLREHLEKESARFVATLLSPDSRAAVAAEAVTRSRRVVAPSVDDDVDRGIFRSVERP